MKYMTTQKFGMAVRMATVGAALLAGAAHTAQAQVVMPFTFVTGNTPYSGVSTVTVDGGATNNSFYVGQYQIQLGSGNNATNYNTFCVDVLNDISNGNSTNASLYNLIGAQGLQTASYNHALNGHTQRQNALAVAYLVDTYLLPTTSKATSEDVQLAIWDIVNDGGDGLSAGNFRLISGDGNASNVNNLESAAYSNNNALGPVTWINNPKTGNGVGAPYQDFAIRGSNYAVPEPGLFTLAACIGTGVFGFWRRKRRA